MLEAYVLPDAGSQQIRGSLRDDVGAPIPSMHVEVRVLSPDTQAPLPLPPAQPCAVSAGGHPPHVAPDVYVLDTDAQGVFCVRTRIFTARGLLRVSFAGTSALSQTTTQQAFDTSGILPSLEWDPPPTALDLDTSRARVSVVLTRRLADPSPRGSSLIDTQTEALAGFLLGLHDESGKLLALGRSDATGHVSFDISSASLGAPGPDTWEARGEEAPATHLLAIRSSMVRFAHVTLAASAPKEAFVGQDGHTFDVQATTARGPCPSGTVEAKAGEVTVGVGAVNQGHAYVVTTFDVASAGIVPMTFSYLPDSPAYRPRTPLPLRVPVARPSPWRKAPLTITAVFLLFWLARDWRRAPGTRPKPSKVRSPLSKPIVSHLAYDEDPKGLGWRGVVIDAHSEEPIADAHVMLIVRDFSGEQTHAETITGEDGAFALQGPPNTGNTLVIEARYHARAELAAPKPGRLQVGLVLRRRVLLDRLLEVAKRSGRLFVQGGAEPTPEQLAKAAEAMHERAPVRWARAVEAAAFGATPVDAALEASVSTLETELPHAPTEGVSRSVVDRQQKPSL